MAETFNPWDFFQENFNGNRNGMNSEDPVNSWDLSWVEDYVNDILSNVMPDSMDNMPRSKRKPNTHHDIFETHHYIIVRFELPKDIQLENVRVSFQTNELKVDGLSGKTEVIRLPKNGHHKGSNAIVKEGVLEVKIPKRNYDSFKEIDVRIL